MRDLTRTGVDISALSLHELLLPTQNLYYFLENHQEETKLGVQLKHFASLASCNIYTYIMGCNIIGE
jgi:hypothetical protein